MPASGRPRSCSISPPATSPGSASIGAHGKVRAFFEEDWFRAFPFEEWEVELDELVDHGDRVIAISRQRGLGASSGAAAELEQGFIFTLRDKEVVRVEVYGDQESALEAAGLSE
jgi:ketosteroid isomerase-like protein